MKQITEELNRGDFSSFEKLNASQKGEIAKNWDDDMKHRYLTRHNVMTEDEFFGVLDSIAEGSFTELPPQNDEFSYLNNLKEEQRIEIMKAWDEATWIRFRMQDTVSEQDVFDPIIRLIENDYD